MSLGIYSTVTSIPPAPKKAGILEQGLWYERPEGMRQFDGVYVMGFKYGVYAVRVKQDFEPVMLEHDITTF